MSDNNSAYISQSISRFDIVLDNSLFNCRVFWARIVSSESESLFTQYLKHSFYELQYSLKGNISLLLEKDTRLSVCERSFVIIPPETYHQITDSEESGARFILAFSLDAKRTKLSRTIEKNLKEIRAFHNTQTMEKLIELMIKKDYYDDPLRKETIRSFMESFFMEMLETVCGFEEGVATQRRSSAEQTVEAIEGYIKGCYGIGISVSELSKRFSFSRRHLQRLFITTRNCTPSEAINRERLKRIEELTVSTRLSFNEISRLCGFCDEYAMNKFFRRHSNTNLSQLRNLKNTSKI
ncbi:MAG: helix-turn-helix domain-containing protein [Ruminococcaceae bacterium]|nr:helix-turn-helix domain-containing protein [Oscillospiraceae bacterium]